MTRMFQRKSYIGSGLVGAAEPFSVGVTHRSGFGSRLAEPRHFKAGIGGALGAELVAAIGQGAREGDLVAVIFGIERATAVVAELDMERLPYPAGPARAAAGDAIPIIDEGADLVAELLVGNDADAIGVAGVEAGDVGIARVADQPALDRGFLEVLGLLGLVRR